MRLTKLFMAAVCVLAFAAPRLARAADAADPILAEINFARAHPRDYALALMLQPVSDWEQSLGADGPAADAAARDEAIDFLLRQAPLPPLAMDDDLAAAALEHVADQGPAGKVGHDGPAGEAFDARIRRHGVAADLAAENIAYGPSRAYDVVRELIIDSGVASRGHRRNLFHDGLLSAGVACGPHRDYGAMCVMDFAGRPLPAAGLRQAGLRQAGLRQASLRQASIQPIPAPAAQVSGDWVLSRGR
jgi:uncharacterized protein YkwD